MKKKPRLRLQAEVSNVDFSKVLKNYQKRAYNYMQDNLYSGNLSKKKLNAKCLSIFANQTEKSQRKYKAADRDDYHKPDEK